MPEGGRWEWEDEPGVSRISTTTLDTDEGIRIGDDALGSMVEAAVETSVTEQGIGDRLDTLSTSGAHILPDQH